jgi:phosphonatase-like hydrolase
MMDMDIKLAVFDLAGTTVKDDDFVAQAFIAAFQHEGIEVTAADVNPWMGVRKTQAIAEVLFAKCGEVIPELVDRIHDSFVGAMVEFYSDSNQVTPMDGAEELFRSLQSRGIRVAVNSGFPRVIVDAILLRFGWIWEGLVDDSIASDEVPAGRPFPHMIRALMDRGGIVLPGQVMKVGDTTVDIEEGRQTECGLVIAVTTGANKREELAEYAPDHIIDHLEAIHGLV